MSLQLHGPRPGCRAGAQIRYCFRPLNPSFALVVPLRYRRTRQKRLRNPGLPPSPRMLPRPLAWMNSWRARLPQRWVSTLADPAASCETVIRSKASPYAAGSYSVRNSSAAGVRAARTQSWNQVAEDQGTERDGHYRQKSRLGRAGHDVDVGGEQIPQEPPGDDTERDSDHESDYHGELDCQATLALSWRPVKPSVLSIARIAAAAADRGDEGQAEGGHRARRQPRPRISGVAPIER